MMSGGRATHPRSNKASSANLGGVRIGVNMGISPQFIRVAARWMHQPSFPTQMVAPFSRA
jgi:hypothetical protein